MRVCDISWMTEAHTLGHWCFSCSTLKVTNYTCIVYMVNMCYSIVFLYWYKSSNWGTYPRSLLPQLFHLKFIDHTRIVYTLYYVAYIACIGFILYYILWHSNLVLCAYYIMLHAWIVLCVWTITIHAKIALSAYQVVGWSLVLYAIAWMANMMC